MKDKILPTKILLVVFNTLWLYLSLSNVPFEAYGDASGDVIIPSQTACVNCSKCEYPCQQPSPPLPGYPSFETPPPPPSPPPSGYSIYEASPPPPPHEKGHSKCPPSAAGVQCCTPPAPYTYAPPNPYTYVPYVEGHASASTLLPVLVPLMMLSSYFIFPF